MNVPMFEPTGLQIVKSVDHAQAEIGDTLTYRIEVHNPTSALVSNVVINDKLPTFLSFRRRLSPNQCRFLNPRHRSHHN
jgi:uncharacterized repeat protein (TIGR01451 family)